MRFLLVEDDIMFGESVLDLLRAEQYAVDWVNDGKTADTTLLSGSYELVLLDLKLPGKNGLDVLRDLRARHDCVPVSLPLRATPSSSASKGWTPQLWSSRSG